MNLTLVGYYLFFAIGLLAFGLLSDKYGRKPVLVAGLAAYVVSSILCAMSVSIYMLIGARVIQALGSGAMSSTCTAIVKDAVHAEQREKMLAIIQIMFVIGPVAAPIIGAGILQVADWRATFWVLAAISAVMLALALAYEETLAPKERTDASIPKTLGRLVVVGRNGAFMAFLLIGASFELGYMAYVSVGSYVYIDVFDFSPLGYSLFFATASIMGAVGPAAWLRLSGRVSIKRFTTFALAASLVIGLAMMGVGHASAYVFCGLFLVFVFFESAVRPYNVNVLLDQQDSDTGSASALINFTRVFVGAIGMFMVMLPFPDYIVAVGGLMTIGIAIALVGWYALLRSKLILRGVKDDEEPESLL